MPNYYGFLFEYPLPGSSSKLLPCCMRSAEEVSTDNVKVAFKSLAMTLHPDRFLKEDEDVQKEAHVKFQKLQIAYDTLRDPEKRLLYDRGQLVQ